ncbi:hypothetical protein PQX77_002256 [Marasmius sp. AFHP31]|nr:hypothetical protein PQX77_002256 [Marasmius sp. AFHP31]
MSESPNFGDTLSGGIQEVSALLPLLGTEQCERHVGTALDKGYLFAAAAPLSIFGSLGIVKTAFATLLATTTKPFYGGWWLDDAGFDTKGSVSSMATLVKGTKRYGAEVQLHRLMKEQHIDDPEMVARIEWFGWRRKHSTDGASKKSMDGTGLMKLPSLSDLPWNASLVLSSMVLSLVGITPYLYLIHDNWGHALSWLYPVLRSFGSLLCVVSVQFALQIRIHGITTNSLLLMKARKRRPLKLEEAIKDRDALLELRLRALREELRDELGRDPDPEKQVDREYLTELQGVLEAHSLSQDALIFLLQALLIAGIAMIVVGYVGCFNLVSRTEVTNGPYVWFGMEAGLAVLRIALWGWNPSWDEGNTGMTMQLALRSKDLMPHTPLIYSGFKPDSIFILGTSTPSNNADAGQLVPDPPMSLFPLITTPRLLSQLTTPYKFALAWHKDEKDSFIVESADDFFTVATLYVGPLPRLEMEELNGILLYYSIVPDVNGTCDRKLLCMTVCRNESKWASISVFIDGDGSYTAFTSHSRDVPGTRTLRVTLEDKAQLDSITIIDRQTLDFLTDHSLQLFSRLCAVNNPVNDQLALSWNVTLPSSPHPGDIGKAVPLTQADKEYIGMRQMNDIKGDYTEQRGNLLLGVFRTVQAAEWGLILDSAVMEVYLCILEHRFVRPISPSPNHFRRLALEWIQGMEDRISLEKATCHRRWGNRPDQSALLFNYETSYDVLAQELRSLRQASSDSIALRSWEETIAIIMDHPDQSPTLSELFDLPLLKSLGYVRKGLLPLFMMDGQTDVPTPAYNAMVGFLRSSLYRLRDAKRSSLGDRIDPYGPGSPEFSPPYTQIRRYSEGASKLLALQIESVRFLQIYSHSHVNSDRFALDVLRLLHSFPPLLSLTTVLPNNLLLTNETCQLIVSILQRHRGIIYLLFDGCTNIDRTEIDEVLAANRQNWQEVAQGRGVFTYTIGCDLNPVNDGNYNAALMYRHDMLLTNRADVCAMIYLPQPGKIVLNISLKPLWNAIAFVAILTRPGSVGETGAIECDEGHTVRFNLVVSDSPEFEYMSVEGFPELQTGIYELRVQLANDRQYLFRELTIDFVPSLAGEESDGNLHGICSGQLAREQW